MKHQHLKQISVICVRYISTKSQHTNTTFIDVSEKDILRPNIKCRNRQYLAGGSSLNFPEYIPRETNSYFKAIRLKDTTAVDFNIIGSSLRNYIDDHISNYSAFLLKGLPLKELNDFQRLITALDYEPLSYDAGTACRQNVEELLYTASDEPKEVTIEPHNEMAYLEKNFPSKIMFWCLSDAYTGGDSPLVFNRDLIRGLSPDLVKKVKNRKIRYVRNLSHERNSSYLTWQETFKTKDEKKAEYIMKRENMSWKWQSNGDLSLWNIVKATIQHPESGEEIWFNQLTSAHSSYYKVMPRNRDQQDLNPNEYHLNTCYGDGEEFEDEVLDEIRSVTWNNAMALKLEPGDVLLLDNLLCLHTRMSFKGDNRKLVVNLSW